jgi:hypothetical protein
MSGWRKRQITNAMENAMKIEDYGLQRMALGILMWMLGMIGTGLIARFLYECFMLGWEVFGLVKALV